MTKDECNALKGARHAMITAPYLCVALLIGAVFAFQSNLAPVPVLVIYALLGLLAIGECVVQWRRRKLPKWFMVMILLFQPTFIKSNWPELSIQQLVQSLIVMLFLVSACIVIFRTKIEAYCCLKEDEGR